jgi:hypothetical protein
VLRRKYHIGHAKDGINARCVAGYDFIFSVQFKINILRGAFTYPVCLHGFYALRPMGKYGNILKEPRRIIGYL